MPGIRRALVLLVVVAALAGFAVQASWTWSGVVDDAYISARYAENLADGHGLVYNADEPAVEGYTNLLWTVLLALGRLPGLPMLDLMTGLGFFFGALTIVATTGLARTLGGAPGTARGAGWSALVVAGAGVGGLLLGLDPVPVIGATLGALAVLGGAAWLSSGRGPGPDAPWLDVAVVAPAVALALSPHLAVATTNGIESSMMSAMVACTLWAHLALRGRARWLGGLVAGALVLTRPEGVAVVGLVGLHDAWIHRRRPSGALPLTGLAVAVTVALFAWRWHTYGMLLPNTFHAKSSFSLAETWTVNKAYFGENQAPLLALAALWALAALLPPYRSDKALVAAVALLLGFVPFTVNLWMPALRLYLSTGALVVALIAAGLQRAPRWLGALGSVVGVAGMAAYLSLGGQRVRAYDGRHTVEPRNGTEVMARHLAAHAGTNPWLATRDAGVLAYYVGTDVKVAELHQRALTQHHPGGANADVKSFTPPNPAFFVATVQRKDVRELAYGQDKTIFRKLSVPYDYLGRVEQHFHRYYDVYARSNLHVPPLPEAIVVNKLGPPPPVPGAAPAPSPDAPEPDEGP